MLLPSNFTQLAISFALLIPCALASLFSVEPRATAAGPYKVAAYYANWDIYNRNFTPQQIPYSKLTHLLYAFANLKPDGTVFLSDTYADLQNHYPSDSWNEGPNNVYGCIKQLYLLKQKNRHMKTLLSIGGWTYSTNFKAAASTATTRARFANTSVAFVRDLGFDGLEIDYEFPSGPPSTTDATNFVSLLQAVRTALNTYSKTITPNPKLLLTVASPAGPINYNALQLKKMDPLLDSWHLMAYDYAGSWSSFTGHDANLFASTSDPNSTPFVTNRTVNDYIKAGVTASKIVLGMPLYGRSFEATAGMGKPYNGIGAGEWDQPGVLDYKSLVARENITYDPNVVGAYSYNAATKELVSFDTPKVVSTKVQYVKTRALGGAMFWEVSSDAVGANSLISTANAGLGGLENSLNCLNYSRSSYTNMAKGMSG